MLTDFPHLLPPTSTPYEKALAGPTGRITDVPVPLRDLWRWDTCPEDLLPWLAWAMSVDLWSPDWPIEKQRAMVRESFDLHRRKGTLYAIERYLAYAGATLKNAIVPPDIPFLGVDMTDEERAEWLARFPQIRVFDYRSREENCVETFMPGAVPFDDLLFLGAGESHDPPSEGSIDEVTAFLVETDVDLWYGRRAFLWDKGPHHLASGEETLLKRIETTHVERQVTYYDFERYLIPDADDTSIFCETDYLGVDDDGDPLSFMPGENTAGNRIVTVALQRERVDDHKYYSLKTTRPSLTPINAFPDTVKERFTARETDVFCGMRGRYLDPETKQRHQVDCFLEDESYLMPNDAGEHLYDRLYLHDPARGTADIDTTTYLNDARFGMPAYHAELAVEVPLRIEASVVHEYVDGYFDERDDSDLNRAFSAIVRSKALRDKTLVRTRLHKTISTRDRISTRDGYRSGGLIALY